MRRQTVFATPFSNGVIRNPIVSADLYKRKRSDEIFQLISLYVVWVELMCCLSDKFCPAFFAACGTYMNWSAAIHTNAISVIANTMVDIFAARCVELHIAIWANPT